MPSKLSPWTAFLLIGIALAAIALVVWWIIRRGGVKKGTCRRGENLRLIRGGNVPNGIPTASCTELVTSASLREAVGFILTHVA